MVIDDHDHYHPETSFDGERGQKLTIQHKLKHERSPREIRL